MCLPIERESSFSSASVGSLTEVYFERGKKAGSAATCHGETDRLKEVDKKPDFEEPVPFRVFGIESGYDGMREAH